MKKSRRLRYLIKGAKMGDPKRTYELGLLYELGLGVEEDMSYAVELISYAARSGYKPAVDWMEDYYFDDDASVQAYS